MVIVVEKAPVPSDVTVFSNTGVLAKVMFRLVLRGNPVPESDTCWPAVGADVFSNSVTPALTVVVVDAGPVVVVVGS